MEERFSGAQPQDLTYVTLDCTDCSIEEPGKEMDTKWYSPKLNGPGLKYEVAISIRTGHIVWVSGGIPCGRWNDLDFAKANFLLQLPQGEKIIADDGYCTSSRFICPSNRPNAENTIRRLLARHETVNGILKSFRGLSSMFRHELFKHRWCFFAVANVTQIMLCYETDIFHVPI